MLYILKARDRIWVLFMWFCSSSQFSTEMNATMDAVLRATSLLLLGLLCSALPPASCRVHIPPHDQVARVARFVAHLCDWASMATVSTHKPVVGQPFSNVFSVSDGPVGTGTGVPYMYLTHMEISVQDLQVKPALMPLRQRTGCFMFDAGSKLIYKDVTII